MIIEKHLELGNRWSEIASNLQGRTENQVKNRYKSLMRKAKALTTSGGIDDLLIKLKGECNEQFAVPKVVNEAMKYFPHMIFNVPTNFDSSLAQQSKDENPQFYRS